MGFTVEIPVPPSLNNIYFNVPKGRRKTPDYAAWKRNVAWYIRLSVQAQETVKGAICVRLELPINTAGDVDNRLKAAIDALVHSGRVDDDRNVYSAEVVRCLPSGDKASLQVRALSDSEWGRGERP